MIKQTECCCIKAKVCLKLKQMDICRNICLLFHWVYCDGSWLLESFCDEGLPLTAIRCCHRDSLQNTISPVDVAMDPIYRYALWGLNTTANYHAMVRGVTGHVYLGAVEKETKEDLFNLVTRVALSISHHSP